MNKFDIMRMVIDIIEEYGYHGSFSVYYVSNLIIVSMALNNNSISEVMSADDIELCREPEYRIRLAINNMMNEIEGGVNND